MKKDAIFIDNTTASAEVARELDVDARKRGFHFIDAPVSGGQAGAENGVLTVMVGAPEAVFERAKPVIDAYARMVGLMGPVGSGQLAKMVTRSASPAWFKDWRKVSISAKRPVSTSKS
jgi:3-hydroxyisobutyrate dehydrogenase